VHVALHIHILSDELNSGAGEEGSILLYKQKQHPDESYDLLHTYCKYEQVLYAV
jgi:hypothetical protein